MAEVDAAGQVNTDIFKDFVPEQKKASDEIGRDQFLILLTEQLKAQNPLEPTDNQEFAAQLAQFTQLETLSDIRSALDEQIETNLLLTQSVSNTSAAGLIGQDVRAVGNGFTYSDEPVDIHYELFSDAGSVTIEVRNSAGVTVDRIEAPAGARKSGENIVQWDGTDLFGGNAAPGEYVFNVTATNRDGLEIEAQEQSIGRVDSVKFTQEGAILVVNGQEIFLGNVLDVRG